MIQLKGKEGGVFDREVAADFRPIGLIALTSMFYAYSALATIYVVRDILHTGNIHLAPLVEAAIGMLIVVIVTIGELLTSGNLWYWVFFAADVAFTMTFSWATFLAWSVALGTGTFGAVVAGFIVASVAAILPERVLLGRRKAKAAKASAE